MSLSRYSAAAALLCLAAGCVYHSPDGGILPQSGGSHTYYSTQTQPKTVVMTDLRSDEEFFRLEIPAGKQFTFDFLEEEGDDTVNTPDLMRYEIWPIGTTYGRLRNALSVPNAMSRRIDVFLRDGEYASADPARRLRTDEMIDRPAWWTPEGGPMPEDDETTLYDR